jgi:hypothetical protein
MTHVGNHVGSIFHGITSDMSSSLNETISFGSSFSSIICHQSPEFTAFLKTADGLNITTLLASILISFPVLGFRPFRSFFALTVHLPKFDDVQPDLLPHDFAFQSLPGFLPVGFGLFTRPVR